MTSALLQISDSGSSRHSTELQPMTGRLRGRAVRSILETEIIDLRSKIGSTCCCCVPYLSTTSAYKYEKSDVPPGKLFLHGVLLPNICFFSGLTITCTFLACFILEMIKNNPEREASGARVGAFMIGMVTGFFPISYALNEWLANQEDNPFIGRAIAQRLIRRRLYIEEVKDTIPDDPNYRVPPKKISSLISAVRMSDRCEEALLNEAALTELVEIFKDLDQKGMGSTEVGITHESTHLLLLNTPDDPTEFSNLIERVNRFIRTPEDYQCLTQLIPANDPRLAFIPIPDAPVEAPPPSPPHDEVAIDIDTSSRETVAIKLNGETISVDRVELVEHSTYFGSLLSDRFAGQNTEIIEVQGDSAHTPFLKILLQKVDSGLEDSWETIEESNLDNCMKLFSVALIYGFDSVILKIGAALVDSSEVSTPKKIEVATKVIAGRSDLHRNVEWNNRIFALLKKGYLIASSGDFDAWITFALKHSFNTAINKFKVWFEETKQPLFPHAVMVLIREEETFTDWNIKLIEHVRKDFSKHTKSLNQYYRSKEFYNWCVRKIEEPTSGFLTPTNIRVLWEDENWGEDTRIKNALARYAADPAHRDIVLSMWKAVEAPTELLELIETFSP